MSETNHVIVIGAGAAGMLAAVELFATGQLPQQGFVRQEQCTLAALSNTRVAPFFEGLLG